MSDSKPILITGGTGFIGSRLALACLERGERVRVLGQTNHKAEEANSQLIHGRGGNVLLGSVTDANDVRQALEGTDVVFHLAAAQHEANVSDEHFRNVNVAGTKNMLEASVKAGVRRFVYGSTIGVFGSTGGATVRDDSPLQPTNIYGETKLQGEKLVASYREKLPVVTVRISETYGPGDRRLLPLFRWVNKGTFLLIGRGANLHHLIYVDDLVEGLWLAALADAAAGRTIVLAGPEPISTADMVAAVANAQGKPTSRLRVPIWPFWLTAVVLEATLGRVGIQPPLHRRRLNFFLTSYSFSGRDARDTLGFEPRVGFQEGAERTAQWYRKTGQL